MASSFIAAGEECNEQNKKAAFRSLRRQCSSNEASFGSHVTKSCVCAPTTHAGSFKCRLHREKCGVDAYEGLLVETIYHTHGCVRSLSFIRWGPK